MNEINPITYDIVNILLYLIVGSKYAIIFSKIILAKLLKTYKFTTDFKYEDLKTENHMTLQFLKDPKINVEKRIN